MPGARARVLLRKLKSIAKFTAGRRNPLCGGVSRPRRRIQYEARSTSVRKADASDIILAGGGLTLVFDTPVNPSNNSWTSYDVPLNDLSGWHVATLSGALQLKRKYKLLWLTSLIQRSARNTRSNLTQIHSTMFSSFPWPSPILDAGSTISLLGLAVSGLASCGGNLL